MRGPNIIRKPNTKIIIRLLIGKQIQIAVCLWLSNYLPLQKIMKFEEKSLEYYNI